MNDVYVEVFINRSCNQVGNGSSILKIKFHIRTDLIFQQLPMREKVKNVDGYIIEFLTIVDIQENVKIVGNVIQIYEGIIYQEKYEKSPFWKVIEKLFALKQKYKDEGNGPLQALVKLAVNAVLGIQITKDNIEFSK